MSSVVGHKVNNSDSILSHIYDVFVHVKRNVRAAQWFENKPWKTGSLSGSVSQVPEGAQAPMVSTGQCYLAALAGVGAGNNMLDICSVRDEGFFMTRGLCEAVWCR